MLLIKAVEMIFSIKPVFAWASAAVRAGEDTHTPLAGKGSGILSSGLMLKSTICNSRAQTPAALGI